MLRRLHPEQPDNFAFTSGNLEWAKEQLSKYPDGRQASAVIPLLWRAQEQEGWVSKPAIEYVADFLDLAYIRVLEVATFYFMFQLQPVGKVAHIQVCGTTSCMICGAEDLLAVCREKIAPAPHDISADGNFSWEEVECLGACANAPMVQIGKDYYEDLTSESFAGILDAFARGEIPTPGPQNGRFAAEPRGGLTSLTEHEKNRLSLNASATLATTKGDTIARITMNGVEPLAPKPGATVAAQKKPKSKPKVEISSVRSEPVSSPSQGDGVRPSSLDGPRDGVPDNLKEIKGIGPKLEKLLQSLGFYHFDQIAAWTSAEVAWVDQNLEGFKGRVSRDSWVAQARTLAEGGTTAFSSKVKKGNVYD